MKMRFMNWLCRVEIEPCRVGELVVLRYSLCGVTIMRRRLKDPAP